MSSLCSSWIAQSKALPQLSLSLLVYQFHSTCLYGIAPLNEGYATRYTVIALTYLWQTMNWIFTQERGKKIPWLKTLIFDQKQTMKTESTDNVFHSQVPEAQAPDTQCGSEFIPDTDVPCSEPRCAFHDYWLQNNSGRSVVLVLGVVSLPLYMHGFFLSIVWSHWPM